MRLVVHDHTSRNFSGHTCRRCGSGCWPRLHAAPSASILLPSGYASGRREKPRCRSCDPTSCRGCYCFSWCNFVFSVALFRGQTTAFRLVATTLPAHRLGRPGDVVAAMHVGGRGRDVDSQDCRQLDVRCDRVRTEPLSHADGSFVDRQQLAGRRFPFRYRRRPRALKESMKTASQLGQRLGVPGIIDQVAVFIRILLQIKQL